MSTASSLALRFSGSLGDLSVSDKECLLTRSTSVDPRIRAATAAIIDDVSRDGDLALSRLAERFDGVRLEALEVPREQCRRALDNLDLSVRRALERAAQNIRTVHTAQRPTPVSSEPEPGINILRRPDPIARAGVYAPGGRAAYPSSVLMCVVPARVAGVSEVILCSPPDSSGAPSPLVLAAAEIAGVDRVFALGGAGAIAAMALGTQSVPRVDRIVGPGNAYVAEAKLQLCGFVAIDAPAGPSELLVVADATADPRAIAAEICAQAEHDPSACVVAVSIGYEVAERIKSEVARALARQPRQSIISESLKRNGGVLVAQAEGEALSFANAYAPEHLLIVIRDPAGFAESVRNAGTVFVGARSSVSFGDYMSGANHVLPTGGLARSYSGLSTLDFVRWTTVQAITPGAACSLAADVAPFAEAEGLPGHASAARVAGSVA